MIFPIDTLSGNLRVEISIVTFQFFTVDQKSEKSLFDFQLGSCFQVEQQLVNVNSSWSSKVIFSLSGATVKNGNVN